LKNFININIRALKRLKLKLYNTKSKTKSTQKFVLIYKFIQNY